MKLYFSPTTFNLIAKSIASFRWIFLAWSAALLILFALLQTQVSSSTPLALVLFALFILFSGLQLLVFSAFIFFFLNLPSSKITLKGQSENSSTTNKSLYNYWLKFYKAVEWCEATLFFILLPLPSLVFIYALIVMT